MSYRIVYGKQTPRYSCRRFTRKKAIIFIVCIAILLIGLRLSGLGQVLWHFILPGDPDVTEAALIGFVENLYSGADLSDTVTVFCREILHGAQ